MTVYRNILYRFLKDTMFKSLHTFRVIHLSHVGLSAALSVQENRLWQSVTWVGNYCHCWLLDWHFEENVAGPQVIIDFICPLSGWLPHSALQALLGDFLLYLWAAVWSWNRYCSETFMHHESHIHAPPFNNGTQLELCELERGKYSAFSFEKTTYGLLFVTQIYSTQFNSTDLYNGTQ